MKYAQIIWQLLVCRTMGIVCSRKQLRVALHTPASSPKKHKLICKGELCICASTLRSSKMCALVLNNCVSDRGTDAQIIAPLSGGVTVRMNESWPR